MSSRRDCASILILTTAFPMLSLADLSATGTLTANTALNLDTGLSGTSGGDVLWNGSTLALQGSATAFLLPENGTAAYGNLTFSLLLQFLPLFGKAPISILSVGSIIGIHTNGGNYSKVLVSGLSGGSLSLQYTTFGASGSAPSITAVENAATNIPPGLPNSGIAQGSLFVVKGSTLGPATYIQATSFPLPNSIGDTSITVTVGSATVNAIMFYSLARQVAAILPSKIPTGAGTLTLTYNGQMATAPITVVQNNIGIYTVSQSGTGDAIAFLNSDIQLITPAHAANPGEIVVFWGTGLGPVTFDESQPAVQTDMTEVPLQVYIGGQQAEVNFRGRNGCCSSADTIYVTVPQGVSGCAVPVLMQIGSIVGNATSIAVAGNGRTCTPVNGSSVLTSVETHTFGTLYLSREANTSISISGSPMTITQDAAGGNFSRFTYTTSPTGSQIDIASYGSCSVAGYAAGHAPASGPENITYLDAGASLLLSGPFGNKSLPQSRVSDLIVYSATLDQTGTTLTPGPYTITGTGGTDVGAFTANYTLAQPFAWTNQSSITTVNRANGLTVNWTGGNRSAYVTIAGSSSVTTLAVTAKFTCTARVSDQTFTVPPVVLLALPASRPDAPGVLSLSTSDYQPFNPPPGVESAGVVGMYSYGGVVTYQ